MSLPVPNLDDRSSQDLVDEAKQLIPKYCPTWTNHNVSDPGVALIELFAWMSEMMLFRLNQVPDAFYTHMLNLIGIPTFPARAATADITFWAATGQSEVSVPAGTEIATPAIPGEDTVVFTTKHELRIVAPEFEYMVSPGDQPDDGLVDRRAAILAGEETRLFTRPPITEGRAFYFGFARSLAGNVLELDFKANVSGIGIDPNDPPVKWEVYTAEDWAPAEVLLDRTGGFNQDGEIRLLMPMSHERTALGPFTSYWVRVVLTRGPDAEDGYKTSPVITGVSARTIGGTVEAEHAEIIGREFLGISNGKPAQVFRSVNRPVLPRGEGETIEVVVSRDGEDEQDERTFWTERDDFQRSGPNDTHFVWDDATGEVHFGPRIRDRHGNYTDHGAVPPKDAQLWITGYRSGGGSAGNVGVGTLNSPRTSLPGINAVENLRAAKGGVDAETVENAKLRGPMTLRAGDRAVTVDDFERLALEADSGIARAHCETPEATGEPMRLLLVPAVVRDDVEQTTTERNLDDFALSPRLVLRVTAHLDDRRILGSSVGFGAPYYQGVSVAARIEVKKGRPAPVIEQRVQDELTRYIDPLEGGDEGTGWPFGAPLNAAAVAQVIEEVDGVERVDDVLLFDYDLRLRRRLGEGKDIIKLRDRSLFMAAQNKVVAG